MTQDAAIEQVLRTHPQGASAREILHALATPIPLRTRQHRLKNLAGQKRILKEGAGRSARYRLPAPSDPIVPISTAAATIRDDVRRRPESRRSVGYDRAFLDACRPNVTCYVSEAARRHLGEVGRPPIAEQPAGTYAKQILSRLLIDLAWNSSRLEGNTYSLLDTKRLIELGEEAMARGHLEAQMILNQARVAPCRQYPSDQEQPVATLVHRCAAGRLDRGHPGRV